MKLKGYYSGDVSYDTGDVVIYDGVVYYKFKDGAAGSPKDTLCWNRMNQPLAEAVMLMMDAIGIANDNAAARTQAEIEKYFLNDQTLILKAGEDDAVTSYAITVDDSGDTPELAVEEIVEDDEEEADT